MTGLPLSRSVASPRTPAHATPYGAAELRLVANRTLLRGFAVASLLAVSAIGGGRWIADALATPALLVSPEPDWILDTFRPKEPATRAASPPAPVGRTSPTPEVRAIPTPISDTSVPDDAPTLAPAGDDVADLGPQADGVPGGAPDGVGVTPILPIVPAEPEPVEPPAREETRIETPTRTVEPTVFEIVEVMPTVATRTMPVYPEIARQAGLEGRVTVRVRVGRDGRVKEASIVRSDNGAFDDSALAAARQWTFTPGIQAGQPVEVWMTIPIRFRQTAR